MPHSTCGDAPSCAIADTILDLPDLHLIDVERLVPDGQHRRGLLRLTVQTDPVAAGEIVACHGCGVLAADHGRRIHRLADAPVLGSPAELIWRKRRWRCPEPRCRVSTWTEDHPDLPARAKLTTRAVAWAVHTLRW
ncbi:MAG: transposase family protein, partial [Janthinobacterium lividum]